MEDEVKKYTRELINAIKKSTVYTEYREAEEVLNQNQELRAKVIEFRRQNFAMQNYNNNIDLFEEAIKFEERFREIRENPVTSHYLQKELALCRLVQKINEKMIEIIDINIEGFEDTII